MRPTLFSKPDDIDHLLEARKHLCAIRDMRSATTDEGAKKVDNIVAQIEKLLGY